ncbi:MAG TPA: hypothetical protein ENO07_07760, partial [candidate division Zixibacteria bacterium]|nr:hypothetical protein [candidate division Zixibacteria bacterium]
MKDCLFQMRLKLLPLAILLLLAAPVFAQVPDQSGEASLEADTLQEEPQIPPPAPPEIVEIKDSDNDHGHSIDLEWELSPDDDGTGNYVTGYEIWRGEMVDGKIEFKLRRTVPYGVKIYTDRGDAAGGVDPLPNGKDYWYKIAAVADEDAKTESEVYGPVQATG